MNIRAKIFGGAQDEPLLQPKKPKGAKADTLHSVPVTRESRLRSNSRGEDRHRLANERARVTYNGETSDVELINLSGGGAMIGARFQPLLWDRLELHLGQHGTIECAVRWLRDDRIGLEFAHETRLDWPSDEVASVLREVITRTFPDIGLLKARAADTEETVEDDIDELRAARRHPLIWSGVLHHDYQSTAVRVRNISRTGAMIETIVAVRVGGEPLLELGPTLSISATVEWAVGDQAGLRFHSPFDMHMLADSRPSVAGSDWTPPSYLESDGADADARDPWGRLTLVELHSELEGYLKH